MQPLPPACCVTLDMSHFLSGPQLAHLWSDGWVVDDLLCSFLSLLLLSLREDRMTSGGVAPCSASRALWHPYPPLCPTSVASLEPETKACSGWKVRPAGMCVGAWLAGPDKSLRLLVNQLEVPGAGGSRAGQHQSHQSLPTPSGISPSSLVHITCRKGRSSCATLVTPVLLCICKARGFLAAANLGPSRGHVT